MNQLESIIEYARDKLVTEKAAHDFEHSYRVMKIAMKIGQHYKNDVDMEIIGLAGIAHDIIDKKVVADVEEAKQALREKLWTVGYKDQVIDHVFDIITKVSYSGGKLPESLEGKIVQDADRLEAIGAIAIARTFAYGGTKGRHLYIKDDPECGIAHFYDKLLLLRDLMNTDIAREIAKERHAYMEAYLERFYSEWNLEDID